jgi:hypothetical protein
MTANVKSSRLLLFIIAAISSGRRQTCLESARYGTPFKYGYLVSPQFVEQLPDSSLVSPGATKGGG